MGVKPRTRGATPSGMGIAYGGPPTPVPSRPAARTGPALQQAVCGTGGGGTVTIEAVMPWASSSRCGSAPVPGHPHGRPRMVLAKKNGKRVTDRKIDRLSSPRPQYQRRHWWRGEKSACLAHSCPSWKRCTGASAPTSPGTGFRRGQRDDNVCWLIPSFFIFLASNLYTKFCATHISWPRVYRTVSKAPVPTILLSALVPGWCPALLPLSVKSGGRA